MKTKNSNGTFVRAVALLVGTAVGAGIFGLPYVFVRAGVGIGLLYLISLGAIVTLVNLAYGEVVTATATRHQFPGYVEKYLGVRWKRLAILSFFIGLYGALTAYLLEVGNLLWILVSPLLPSSTRHIITIVFIALMAIALYIGLKAVSRVERVLMFIMIFFVMVLVIEGWPSLDYEHYTLMASSRMFFLPYGVVLFALAAASVIPDMKATLAEKLPQLKRAIIIGSVIPIAVYVAFGIMVVGITGDATTENALVGLGQTLGPTALILGSVFGIVTMTTSFLALGLVLKEVYVYDMKLSPLLGLIFVILPPLVIVVLNLLTFIEILGISGALIGGVDGIIIMKMHRHLHERQDRQSAFTITQSRLLHILCYLVFGGGIVYEIYVVGERLF